jgi:hypothetical protein
MAPVLYCTVLYCTVLCLRGTLPVPAGPAYGPRRPPASCPRRLAVDMFMDPAKRCKAASCIVLIFTGSNCSPWAWTCSTASHAKCARSNLLT